MPLPSPLPGSPVNKPLTRLVLTNYLVTSLEPLIPFSAFTQNQAERKTQLSYGVLATVTDIVILSKRSR